MNSKLKYSQETYTLLQAYDIELQNGFLPGNVPLERLPIQFQQWESINSELANSIKDKSFCKKIAALPILKVGNLNEAGKERAMLLLGAFAHSYVKESNTNIIPKQLAMPWVQIAEGLNRLPILTHSNLSLQNWRLIDPSRPFCLENLATQISFTGTITESWFFLTTTNIEKVGGRAIPMILESIHLARNGDAEAAIRLLDRVLSIGKELMEALQRMYEFCDPTIFYNDVRNYFDSFKEVQYLGTKPEIRSYPGGSAAQSSLLQFFDLALGIDYGRSKSYDFLLEMRNFMPFPHRNFLNYIEKDYNLKDERKNNPKLNEACLEIVEFLIEFRNEHLKMVGQYIFKPAQKNQSSSVGTGGTNPMIFLKEVRNKNKEHRDH